MFFRSNVEYIQLSLYISYNLIVNFSLNIRGLFILFLVNQHRTKTTRAGFFRENNNVLLGSLFEYVYRRGWGATQALIEMRMYLRSTWLINYELELPTKLTLQTNQFRKNTHVATGVSLLHRGSRLRHKSIAKRKATLRHCSKFHWKICSRNKNQDGLIF